MTYQSIKDVPERDVAMSLDFLSAVAAAAPSRTAVRFATDIAHECLLAGESRITHKELQRRAGVCRRTTQHAIHSLLDRDIIRRIGTTPQGSAIYQACWERGDEWRARAMERAHAER